jgi:hypothetical protein
MNRAGQAAIIVAAMVAVPMGVRMGAQSGSTTAPGTESTALRQTAYVKASNPHMGDHFGNGGTLLGDSVALSGDGLTMASGAPNESSGAKGINGNQDDTSVYNAGAVYIFTRRNAASPWVQQAYVKASNPQVGAEFGHVVTLSADGNTMAVSAYFEASATKGINGNQNDDSIPQAGAVYIFTRRGTTWAQQAYIKASNTGEAGTDGNFGDGDQFGFSVALSDDGNTLAVGANAEDSSAKGINGDQNDNSMQSAGAVYVFVRSGTTWTQQAYMKAPNTTANVQFGYAVALSADGNTLATSAFDEGGSSRTVINGPNGPFPPGRNGTGAIYVYTRSAATWTLQSYLKVSNAENNDSLGVVVSISDDGNTIAGGILDEDCPAAGVNPSAPCDNDMKADTSVGAAVVFVRQGTQWAQQAYIKASNPGKEDWFGSRLQISGDGNTLAVSAQLEDGAAQGINGKQDNDSAQEAGAVYLFGRTGTQWVQRFYIKSSNDEAFDEFGSSVALSRDGRTLAAGARGEDSIAKGTDGQQGDNSAKEAGAVYVFTYNPSAAGRSPATR